MNIRAKSNCHICKGRGFCGRPYCPIYARAEAMFKVKDISEKDISGSSPPSVFVGHFAYPNVNVGVLSLTEQRNDAGIYDAPKLWAKNRTSISDVVNYRTSLVNSRFNTNINKPEKLLGVAQEVACAVKKADIEVEVNKIHNRKIVMGPDIIPMGVAADVNNIKIVSNIHIPRHIDRVVSSEDMKSVEGIGYLFKKGYDEYLMSKLLSIGNMGVKENRKLVPTRWSITAIDDNIAKQLLNNIKMYPEIENFELYYGGIYGNRFAVLLIPGSFEFELYEFWFPGSTWYPDGDEPVYSTDYEGVNGRKTYASQCGGGYYAAKLPIIQNLFERKRRAKVLVVREVSSEYWCPLGVWVVRESVRTALNNKKSFSNANEALDYMSKLLRINFYEVKQSSKIIHYSQKSIMDF